MNRPFKLILTTAEGEVLRTWDVDHDLSNHRFAPGHEQTADLAYAFARDSVIQEVRLEIRRAKLAPDRASKPQLTAAQLADWLLPTNHKYTVHPSFTGLGCAHCGNSESEHAQVVVRWEVLGGPPAHCEAQPICDARATVLRTEAGKPTLRYCLNHALTHGYIPGEEGA